MRTILTLVLLIGTFFAGYYFCAQVIHAGAAGPSCMVVSPVDTSPSTLLVTMTITEDQTASDGKSSVRLQFNSRNVGGDNCVNFAHGETVTCNNDGSGPLVFDSNKAAYATRVGPTGDYICAYHPKSQAAAVPITMPRGTALRPEFLPSNQARLTVTYSRNNDNSDPRLRTCPVEVDAKDGGQPISASNLPDNGQYTIPDISGLSGQGTIVITRTCMYSAQQQQTPQCVCQTQTAFASVKVTYYSIATLAMTWNPTDP